MLDRLLERGLGSSFGMPSVYITGPDGIEATSSDRIIQRGDVPSAEDLEAPTAFGLPELEPAVMPILGALAEELDEAEEEETVEPAVTSAIQCHSLRFILQFRADPVRSARGSVARL